MSVGKCQIGACPAERAFLLYFLDVTEWFRGKIVGDADPEKDDHVFQGDFWKCSPMANIFQYPNLVIPHLGPGLEGAYELVRRSHPIINTR